MWIQLSRLVYPRTLPTSKIVSSNILPILDNWLLQGPFLLLITQTSRRPNIPSLGRTKGGGYLNADLELRHVAGLLIDLGLHAACKTQKKGQIGSETAAWVHSREYRRRSSHPRAAARRRWRRGREEAAASPWGRKRGIPCRWVACLGLRRVYLKLSLGSASKSRPSKINRTWAALHCSCAFNCTNVVPRLSLYWSCTSTHTYTRLTN
jgi:hypothetical protein